MCKCGQITEVYSRVCGYYRPTNCWNKGKAEEFKDRKAYDTDKINLENKETSKKVEENA